MTTLATLLARHDVAVPDDVLADIEVPVLAGPQRQGDILIVPRGRLGRAETRGDLVTAKGVAVVRGEATGNTHILDAYEGTVRWAPHTARTAADVVLGVLEVEPDSVAALTHTDEHGCNLIGPGVYVLHGKREQAEELRRVAD